MSDTGASDTALPVTPPPGSAADGLFGTVPIDTVLSRPRPGVVLLEVDGELDTLTTPRLEADLDGALATARADGAAVVVDLRGVTFLASSGLAVLVYGARRAQAAGVRLHLVADSRAVLRPLEVTGADALFALHSDPAPALAAAVAPPPGE